MNQESCAKKVRDELLQFNQALAEARECGLEVHLITRPDGLLEVSEISQTIVNRY